LSALVKKAMALNDEGTKVVRGKRPAAPIAVPAELTAALGRNKNAHTAFSAFPPSHRRDYVEWIVEAEGEETRNRRLKTAIQWMAEGKPRNWKYMRT
jgi:uncharacterized protein YdeI (YjbR/CyaY-like superfamily)